MNSENFLLLLRLGFSLALVFGLMWVAAKVVRGRAGGLGTKVDHLEVLERKPLAKGSSIAIVRIGNETVAVGITDSRVSLLGTAEVGTASTAEVVNTSVDSASAPANEPSPVSVDLDPTATVVTTGGRRSFVDSLRDRTVRHIPG